MRKLFIACVACVTIGCGTSPTAPTGTTGTGSASLDAGGASGAGGVSTVRSLDRRYQCTDAPVQWITQNFSTDKNYFVVAWQEMDVDAYDVEVTHNRNGEPPTLVFLRRVSRTDLSIADVEHGGRYYVRVRVHNRCDVDGAWSETLIVYLDGNEMSQPSDDGGETPGDDDGDGGDDRGGGGDDGGMLCEETAHVSRSGRSVRPDPQPCHGHDDGTPGQGHA